MSGRRWTVAVFAATTLACQPLTEVDPADLEGFWLAEEARWIEIEAPKRNNVDLIDRGYAITMDLDATGNFVILLVEPGGALDIVTGVVVIDGTTLQVTTQNGTGDGDVFLEGDQVAFRLTGGFEFEFDDGRTVPARLLLVLNRTG